ncbi:MAG: hypothetical protein ACI9ZT_002104 [Gammaproteobacteria bacterium]|jgi:hypothetical protein
MRKITLGELLMGDIEKDKSISIPQEKDSKAGTGEQKRKPMNDKLRKKMEKLKKDDPNIHPVF